MKIGPITIPEAGERATGTFTFSDDEGLAKYEWPYIAIVGLRAGATFLITAGIHAAEYTGIEAAIRLGRTISPDAVRGTILILPLLNRPGFYERSIYVNPEDGDNLNRLFPGKPDGTWGERFAHHLLTEIITKCDYSIDLHAGDLIEDLEPFVIYRETGTPALDERIRGMADAYGARWAVKGMPTSERPGSLFAVASLNGVASMIAESGGRAARHRRHEHPSRDRIAQRHPRTRRAADGREELRVAALASRRDLPQPRPRRPAREAA